MVVSSVVTKPAKTCCTSMGSVAVTAPSVIAPRGGSGKVFADLAVAVAVVSGRTARLLPPGLRLGVRGEARAAAAAAASGRGLERGAVLAGAGPIRPEAAPGAARQAGRSEEAARVVVVGRDRERRGVAARGEHLVEERAVAQPDVRERAAVAVV